MFQKIKVFILLILLGCFTNVAQGASLAEYITSLVRRRDEQSLRQVIAQYGSLDYTDSRGQTPLCQAVIARDYEGFALLSRLGANKQSPCMQSFSSREKQIFNQNYRAYWQQNRWRSQPNKKIASAGDVSPVLLGLAGLAAAGGAVALAAGGGGGGGSSSSGSSNSGNNSKPVTPVPDDKPTNSNPTTPDTGNSSGNTGGTTGGNTGGNSGGTTGGNSGGNSGGTTGGNSSGNSGGTTGGNSSVTPTVPDRTYTLKPSDFQTSEYYAGRFLDQINAASAYARLYTASYTTNNKVQISSSNIKTIPVAVIDSGMAKHTELSSKVINSANFDYGPCMSAYSRNCWTYKSSRGSSGLAFVDASGNTSSIIYSYSAAEYNAWASSYSSTYAWSPTLKDYEPNSGTSNVHGTHVAGIIAASKNGSGMQGVAPNAALIPIKYDFFSSFSDPIIAAVDMGARVINASLGTAPSTTLNASTAKTNPSYWYNWAAGTFSEMSRGLEYLAKKKTTVLVLAAGNEKSSQPSPETGAGLYYKGLENLIVSVVAVDPKNPTQLASYSNKCGATASYCIAAPGGTDSSNGLVSTVYTNSYASISGTSMATPVVSGSIALLMGAYPNLSAAQVVSLLFETATDLGNSATFGHGLLNLDAATKPVGKTTLAMTNQVSGAQQAASASVAKFPSAISPKVMQALPENVVILDKYERAFEVPTKNFIQKATRDSDAFKNTLHRFKVFNSNERIQTPAGISFGYSKASKADSLLGLGAMDALVSGEKNQVRFYYLEDSKFGAGEYFDRTHINPFSAMKNAYGITDTYHFSKNFAFKAGFVTGENAFYQADKKRESEFKKQAYSFDTGIEYKPAEKWVLGVSGGLLYEQDAALGLHGSGGFKMDDSSTYYMGLTASYEPLKSFAVSAGYYIGMTQSNNNGSLIKTSKLYSDGFAADARWQATQKDVFGVQMLSPLRINRGTATFDLPVGRDYYSDTVYRQKVSASLKPERRETDWYLYYLKEINPAMRFKTQGGVRLNPDHQNQRPDYQILTGFDWKFNTPK